MFLLSNSEFRNNIDKNNLFLLTNTNIENINYIMIDTNLSNQDENSWSDLDESALFRDTQIIGEQLKTIKSNENICCKPDVNFLIVN